MSKVRLTLRYKIRLKNSEILFFTAFILFLILSIFRTSFFYVYFSNYYNMLMYGIMLLLAVQELLRKTISRKALIGAGILLAMLSMAMSVNQLNFSVMLLLVFSARNIDYKRIMKFAIVITVVCCLIVVFCALVGVIPNYKGYQSDGGVRQYLGFRYVLYLPTYLSNIIMMVIYLKQDKIKYRELLLLATITLVLYKFTIARLTCIQNLFMCFVGIIFKFRPNCLKKHPLIRYVMCGSFLIGAAVSFWVISIYDANNSSMWLLNELLTDRLAYSKQSLEAYGISWLPQRVSWIGYGLGVTGERGDVTFYVDCLYLKILQQYGIIMFVLVMILMTSTMVRVNKKKDFYLLTIITIIAIHWMIDDLYIGLNYNTFLFVIGNELIAHSKDRSMLKFQFPKKRLEKIQ